jgi:hypothetical protein
MSERIWFILCSGFGLLVYEFFFVFLDRDWDTGTFYAGVLGPILAWFFFLLMIPKKKKKVKQEEIQPKFNNQSIVSQNRSSELMLNRVCPSFLFQGPIISEEEINWTFALDGGPIRKISAAATNDYRVWVSPAEQIARFGSGVLHAGNEDPFFRPALNDRLVIRYTFGRENIEHHLRIAGRFFLVDHGARLEVTNG